ncbi:hypothetical protein R6Q59_030574 [Mikania micrantha]
MEGFIRDQDFKLWKPVLEGPLLLLELVEQLCQKINLSIQTTITKKMEVDSKALWLIQMSIPNSIIHAFKKCKSAKELWNFLQQMYESSDNVKKNKKDTLKLKFKNFCQENNENMASQYLRYVQLVDELVRPKTTPLSDIIFDFKAINRKEKRMEKPSKNPVTSNVAIGKAIGSGCGIGRAGAGALKPAPNLC